MAEGGVPGYDAAACRWRYADEDADAIIDKLHGTLRAFQATPEFKTAISRRGLAPW